MEGVIKFAKPVEIKQSTFKEGATYRSQWFVLATDDGREVNCTASERTEDFQAIQGKRIKILGAKEGEWNGKPTLKINAKCEVSEVSGAVVAKQAQPAPSSIPTNAPTRMQAATSGANGSRDRSIELQTVCKAAGEVFGGSKIGRAHV